METNKNKSLLCIFCLKPMEVSTAECEYIRKSDQQRFFKIIIRQFLSYSALICADNHEWCRIACKVISEMTINSDCYERFFENVRICENCEGITQKFSDLYHQMKELQLRIDWEVGKLQDAMECGDKVISNLDKNEFENTSTFDGGRVTLGEFRTTLKDSCQAYQKTMKTTVPNVELMQMNVEDKESSLTLSKDHGDLIFDSERIPIISEECIITPPKICEYLMQLDAQENSTQQDAFEYKVQLEEQPQKVTLQTEEVEVMEHTEEQNISKEFPEIVTWENYLSSLPSSVGLSDPEPLLILQEEDPLNPPNSFQGFYVCTTSACSLPFTSKYELFQHNMANHISKYFLSVQPSFLSIEQFNHYIVHFLAATVDTINNVDKENNKCPFCLNVFPERQKVQNHLVVEHRPIIKEKLVQLEKTLRDLSQPLQIIKSVSNTIITDDTTRTTLKRKSDWTKGKSFVSKRLKSVFNCTNCSTSFPKYSLLVRHDTHNHPENLFLSIKPEFLTLHQFQNCVAHMLNTTADEFQKAESKYQCNFCSQKISDKYGVKNHLIRKHRSVLNEKLVELQNSNNINLIMNTIRRTNNGRTLSARNNTPIHHICNVCAKNFKSGFLLYEHQTNVHPEIFFDSSNLFPSSSENNEQFKTIVGFVLEKYIETPVPKQGHQVKCGICLQVLWGLKFARKHLISRHRDFLVDKLEDEQKNGKSLHQIENEMLRMSRAKQAGGKRSIETGIDFPVSVSQLPTP